MTGINKAQDINRDIYEDMKNQKKRDSLDKVLYIQGTRQVGKTYAIKKFDKDNYDSNNGQLFIARAILTVELMRK